MPVAVKICGITCLDDARAAAGAGADLLGFVFYRRSPRVVTAERVASIVESLRGARRVPRLVGVFVDETAERMAATLERCGLDLAQLHGSEPPALLRELGGRAFKAVRPRALADVMPHLHELLAAAPAGDDLPALLLDTFHPDLAGGSGRVGDWSLAAALAPQVPRLLLGGGLTPENVGAAVAAVRPWGVDVSSGVEAEKGKKDPARVAAFMRAVKG